MLTLADYLATLHDYEGKQAVAPVVAVLDLFALDSADETAVAEAEQLAAYYWPGAHASDAGRRQLLVAAAACIGRMTACRPDGGRPERLADVITALLAPFGDAMTFETLLLLAQQHDNDDGYNFACRLAGKAIAEGGARDMAECVLHYMPHEVATWAADKLNDAGKHAERDVMLAAAEQARKK